VLPLRGIVQVPARDYHFVWDFEDFELPAQGDMENVVPLAVMESLKKKFQHPATLWIFCIL